MSSATDVPPPKPTLQLSTAVTATDHGQIVVLVAWLCFTAGVLLSLVRVYIRWPLNALAGKDDVAYAVSALLAIIQTAITINAVNNGFGRTESELGGSQVVDAAKAIYATDLIFILSTWIGKLSVSFLFTRLAQESNKTRLGLAASALVSTFGIISLISVAIRPDTTHPWLYHEEDITSILGRWIAMGVMSIFTDIVVTGMAIYLVWDLNMASKSKSLVITAFALRLFVIPVTTARLVTLGHVQYDDLSFSYSLPEVMTQLEMYCNLITTTLPCLRLFLTAWNTSFMDMRLEEIDHDAYREHVTTLSGSGGTKDSKASASRSRPGILSQQGSRASHAARATWAPNSQGKSKAFVESGSGRKDSDKFSDAASDNSERAIVVKTTVDVS
ncbi:hypothetical protein Q7P35_010322 [Cladosporium inversicolor]